MPKAEQNGTRNMRSNMAERKEKQIVPAVPAKPEKKVEVITYICDTCSYENKSRQYFSQCSLCGRLVCKRLQKSCCQSDPREWGDYPANFCPICYELKFKKYDKEYEDMIERHYNEIDALDEKIKKESLERTK